MRTHRRTEIEEMVEWCSTQDGCEYHVHFGVTNFLIRDDEAAILFKLKFSDKHLEYINRKKD